MMDEKKTEGKGQRTEVRGQKSEGKTKEEG